MLIESAHVTPLPSPPLFLASRGLTQDSCIVGPVEMPYARGLKSTQEERASMYITAWSAAHAAVTTRRGVGGGVGGVAVTTASSM